MDLGYCKWRKEINHGVPWKFSFNASVHFFPVFDFWRKDEKNSMKGIIGTWLKVAFIFSFAIEMLQLFFRLGTWQLSDLFYNTVGGGFGGVLYYGYYCLKKRYYAMPFS